MYLYQRDYQEIQETFQWAVAQRRFPDRILDIKFNPGLIIIRF